MRVAESLEKANLRGEAVNEYASIAKLDGIYVGAAGASSTSRIEALRKQ